MSATEGSALPTAADQTLGDTLKKLRLQHPSTTGKPVTQADMARLVIVGGKGVVSLYESGKRLPDVATLQQYARVTSTDLDHLLSLRESARVAFDQQTQKLDALDQSDELPPTIRTRHVFTSRKTVITFRVAVAVAVAGVLGFIIFEQVNGRSSTDGNVQITFPTNTVGLTTPVDGTVRGLSGDDLWLDVQSVGDSRYHTTETPCIRHGDKFTFDPLYVGRTQDVGVTFRIVVLATTRGSNGDAALYTYGRRSKTPKGAYDGLVALPDEVSELGTVLVVRK